MGHRPSCVPVVLRYDNTIYTQAAPAERMYVRFFFFSLCEDCLLQAFFARMLAVYIYAASADFQRLKARPHPPPMVLSSPRPPHPRPPPPCPWPPLMSPWPPIIPHPPPPAPPPSMAAREDAFEAQDRVTADDITQGSPSRAPQDRAASAPAPVQQQMSKPVLPSQRGCTAEHDCPPPADAGAGTTANGAQTTARVQYRPTAGAPLDERLFDLVDAMSFALSGFDRFQILLDAAAAEGGEQAVALVLVVTFGLCVAVVVASGKMAMALCCWQIGGASAYRSVELNENYPLPQAARRRAPGRSPKAKHVVGVTSRSSRRRSTESDDQVDVEDAACQDADEGEEEEPLSSKRRDERSLTRSSPSVKSEKRRSKDARSDVGSARSVRSQRVGVMKFGKSRSDIGRGDHDEDDDSCVTFTTSFSMRSGPVRGE
jgi:hypothetical protein